MRNKVLGACLMACLWPSLAWAQLITFTTDKTTVTVGESYTLRMVVNGDQVHNVYVDGVYWGAFLQPGECAGSPIICTHTWLKTPSSDGTITHVLTSTQPTVTTQVTVMSAPTAWDSPVSLTTSSPIYSSHAADGTNVLACFGDGTLYCRWSFDAGASWAPWQNLGSGTLYLERPIAVRTGAALVATVDVTKTITDFAGPRPVGDLSVRRYVNGAFQAKQPLTNGAAAFRVSSSIDGPRWCVSWMDYRTGLWNLALRCSQDGGVTWAPEQIIGVGTNSVGAERPALTMQNGIGVLAWMDARDNHPACQLEGGGTIPICTEVYTSRSTDGGVTWGTPQRRTFSGSGYAGRPDIAQRGSTALLVYDSRAVGQLNDLALLRSDDGGATWGTPQVWTVPGEQTHGSLSSGPGGFGLAAMDARTGTYQVWFRLSADGVTWTPDEQVSFGGAGAPAIAQTDSFHTVTWGAGPLQFRRRALVAVSVPPPPTDPCVDSPLAVTVDVRASGHTVTWAGTVTATDERGCTSVVRQ